MQMNRGTVFAAIGLLMLSGTRKNLFCVASTAVKYCDLAQPDLCRSALRGFFYQDWPVGLALPPVHPSWLYICRSAGRGPTTPAGPSNGTNGWS